MVLSTNGLYNRPMYKKYIKIILYSLSGKRRNLLSNTKEYSASYLSYHLPMHDLVDHNVS